ncbi:MAG: hypothetical protein HOE02_00910 [Candidatus Marinimicrobia bacterium]|nr:hypothetical protein [Candidatus Neomarinimicrobiota bacterium]MBT6929313.1 hypothetical protein [Candidatus Neomarinimicrobiota bacterium]
MIPESEFLLSEEKQSVQKIFIPESDKQTEMIEGEPDAIVSRLMDVLKNEVKVL